MSTESQSEPDEGPYPHRFKGYWIVLGMAILIAIVGWIIWEGAPQAS